MEHISLNKLRSTVLHKGETLYVIYTGKLGNFAKNTPIPCKPRFAHKSGLPYPEPKWIASYYQIDDLDGDSFMVANERYGKLYKDFEWVK